jgi:CrcB protein
MTVPLSGAVLCAASVAGGLGASLRLIVDGVVRSVAGGRLPWGTLIINVTGSFALGALFGAGPSALVATVVGTGLLGGFTTFSTASFETAVLVLEHRRLAGVAYAVGTLLTAVAAAATGYAATS